MALLLCSEIQQGPLGGFDCALRCFAGTCNPEIAVAGSVIVLQAVHAPQTSSEAVPDQKLLMSLL